MSSSTQHEDPENAFAIAPADAGASLTYPLQMSGLRKGGHVLIKGHPCKISNLSTSKPGKHGHAKVSIDAYDIFNHRKYEDSQPAHSTIDVPVVFKRGYQLLNVERDGFLSLFSYEAGETKDDVKVPEGEVGEKVMKLWTGGKRDLHVVVMASMGMEIVVEVAENRSD